MSTVLDRIRDEQTATLEREVAGARSLAVGALSWLFPVALVAFVTACHAIGFRRSPMYFDDEGTYASQAWSVTHLRALAPYTYWYDHPPLGWLILALFRPLAQVAGVNGSLPEARAVMIGVFAVSSILVYAVARSFGLRRLFAGLAVALFAMSPLSLHFQRMVLLDNLATPFILAAFALAAARRYGLWSQAGAAICLALAVLCKETAAAFLPAVALLLWRSSPTSTRRYVITVAASLFTLICLYYPLYALLKGELLPGHGHVSLVGALRWQLFDRPTSGTVVDPDSLARQTVMGWVSLDRYLLLGGLAAMVVCAFSRRTQALSLALFIQILILFKPGYLPELFVVASLPFAALLIAASLDLIWATTTTRPTLRRSRRLLPLRLLGPLAATTIALAAAVIVVPVWANSDQHSMNDDENLGYRSAIAYASQHIAKNDRLLVDDVAWTELIDAGFSRQRVVWMYKLDLDPAVRCRYPDGWRDFDYVLRSEVVTIGAKTLPQTRAALAHAHVVATFGSGVTAITIMRVANSPRRVQTPVAGCAALP